MELVRLGTELDNLDDITLGCLRSEFSVFNKLRSSYRMYIYTYVITVYINSTQVCSIQYKLVMKGTNEHTTHTVVHMYVQISTS